MKRHLKLHPLENAYTRYMMKRDFENRNLVNFKMLKVFGDEGQQ